MKLVENRDAATKAYRGGIRYDACLCGFLRF